MNLKTCYSTTYAADTPTTSGRKLQPVADAVFGKYAEQVDPTTLVSDDDLVKKLLKLHSKNYVWSVLSGQRPQCNEAFGKWKKEWVDSVLAQNKGQLVAAKLALKHGFAANLTCAHHHATPHGGGGFCFFNGLALVAQELAPKKVFVLDCDEHGGNGTEAFTKGLYGRKNPNLFQSSLHGETFGCKGVRGRSWAFKVQNDFDAYLKALEESFSLVESVEPDLVVYYAGVDCHEDDPLGSVGLTTEQLRQRDQKVFEFLAKNNVPTLLNLAGGYQEPLEEKLVPLHVQTFEEAYRVYEKVNR